MELKSDHKDGPLGRMNKIESFYQFLLAQIVDLDVKKNTMFFLIYMLLKYIFE